MDSGNRGSIQSSSGGTALSSSPTVHFDPPKTDPVQPQPQQLARNPKKRSRASRIAPTTVLPTDTTNFRAMFPEFTGIPALPFTSSSSPFLRNRLDLFGTPAAASTRSYPLSDGLYPGLSYNKDMVGAFLISAAQGIVERLHSQAKDLISNKINKQINLASSFTEDLEDLGRTLEFIHALLHDADQNRKITSATILVWLKNLEAVICDAEDLLDELAYEALRRKIEVQDSMVNQPTLVDINIWSCRKLRMLNPTDETEAAFNGSTSLQRLVIAYCELTCLPKGLLQPTLAYLDLEGCPELKAPNPDELRSLTSLKDLTIKSPNPNWGSGWEEGLFCTTSLQRLEIGEFGEEYRYFPWPSTSAASPPWSHFTSLRSLRLWGWPEVKSQPDQLEHLPALETLSICHFSGLESLPEWLSNLTSLQYLGIFSCTLVEERCEEGIGEDWHKIAHIPDLRIDKAWKWKLPITSLES